MAKGLSPSWGIVSTILAPTSETLRFVAYHLELGAHRVYIYLDDENAATFAALKAHPKVRVQICDKAWWKKRIGKPPHRHQVRQTMNATQCYRRRAEVDWLAHIDVDEFLVPEGSITAQLAALPEGVHVARVHPMELLADGDGQAYKRFIPVKDGRARIVKDLYPNFGRYLRGGFLSHTAGKIFVRTGLGEITLRIHKAFVGDTEVPGAVSLPQTDLAHRHALSWDDWHSRFQYRLEKGAYRGDVTRDGSKKTRQTELHEFFRHLIDTEGLSGLHAFHDEVAADTPAMRRKLADHDLLRVVDLDLESAVQKHFPDAV